MPRRHDLGSSHAPPLGIWTAVIAGLATLFVASVAVAESAGLAALPAAVENAAPESAKAIPTLHAIAMHGEPKYPPGFDHFDHADPAAPKGGSIRLGVEGTFDSLNPLIIKGVPAAGLREFLYESLLERGLDEPFTLYAALADRVEMPDDRTSITFHIDPDAAFSDGHKIDAEDLLFSWRILRDHGRPNHRAYYTKVTKAVTLSDRVVRFELGDGKDRELPLILGLMPILPAHLLTEDSFTKTTLVAPVGSGPYVIAEVDPGRSITYARDPKWWGRDRPAHRGRFNFDRIKFEYFRDGSALFEAFKSGRIDVRNEESPTQWAEGYDIPAVRDGRLKKREFPIGLPAGMTALAMNARRDVFADPRVREGMIELFDFEWVNQNLYHGLYTRTQSYFARSDLSSHGKPADAKERELLAPFANMVLPSVLEGRHAFPKTSGDGNNRDAWRRAMVMFNKAGYRLKDGILTHGQTGKPLAFEMLAASVAQQRLFLAYARDLKRLGIDVRVRIVDSTQYQARLKTYDYDMIQVNWPSSLSPGNEQLFRWSSQMVDRDGTFNFAGVANPAVDAMIVALLSAHSREDFVSAVRALDRVLLSGHYVVPLFHVETQWIAYWDRLMVPEYTPLFGYQLDSWWMADSGPSN